MSKQAYSKEVFRRNMLRNPVSAKWVVFVIALGFGVRILYSVPDIYRYDSLTTPQKAAMILNSEIILLYCCKYPEAYSSSLFYGLRDTLYESGMDQGMSLERSAAWLAIYFNEYLVKRCRMQRGESDLPNNAGFTGPIMCGDEVLEEALRHLEFMAEEENVPNDFKELYFVSALWTSFSLMARVHAHDGRIDSDYLDRLKSLAAPDFSRAAKLPRVVTAYRALFAASNCMWDASKTDAPAAEKEAARKTFKRHVDAAKANSRGGNQEEYKQLRRIIKHMKDTAMYTGGAMGLDPM